MKQYVLDKIRKNEEFKNMPTTIEYDSIDWRNFIRFLWDINSNSTNLKLKKRASGFISWVEINYNGRTLSEKMYMFMNNINDVPLCVVCNKNNVRFLRVTTGYRTCCSGECSNKNPIKKINRKNTFIKKYNVESPFASKEIQQKIKAVNLEKYGAENPFASNVIKSNIKIKNLELYGVENSSQREDVKQKTRNTNLSKTNFQKEKEKEKRIATSLLRYGVEYPMQHPDVKNKSAKHAKNFKKYYFASGKCINIQGYENVALDILLLEYNEIDIYASHDIPFAIDYFFNNKNRKYFPDIFIKSTNTIYEIKSYWTLKTHIDEINAKREACISNGFNFIVLLCSKTKILKTLNSVILEGDENE